MIQKWYNRIMWVSGLILIFGTLIGMPILGMLDLDVMVYHNIVLIVPISGIIFLLCMFWGAFSKPNYFSHWINKENIPD